MLCAACMKSRDSATVTAVASLLNFYNIILSIWQIQLLKILDNYSTILDVSTITDVWD